MMEEVHDLDTGEVISTSDAAVRGMLERAELDRAQVMGFANAQLFAALMAATKELPVWITTDKDGAHKIKYATLKAILETVRPKLLEQGIRIRQGTDPSRILDEGGGSKGRLIPVYTDLIHCETGQIDRTVIEIPLTRLDPQAMGSAITYGRRYSLLAALGLATDEADDDGEGAKLKTMDDHTESPELAAISREMAAMKDATKLAEWASEAKQQKRYSALSDQEQGMLRARKAERVKELLSVDEKPAKKVRE